MESPVYNGTAFNGFLVCGSSFTSTLNTAKSTNYIEKFFRQKQSKIKFSKKQQQTRISISPRSGARGLQRLAFSFQGLIFQKQQMFAPSSFIPERVGDIRFTEFLIGNSIILIDFCLKHFLIYLELQATFSPNANILSHTSTLLLLLFIQLKTNKCQVTPISTPMEDRDVRLLGFNFRQFLYEASEIGEVDTLQCFHWCYS